MKQTYHFSATLLAAALLVMAMPGVATATEPCDPDFGECKALIEINSSDGDIGFHFLGDADELIRAALFDPSYRKVFFDSAHGPLRKQFMTEMFVESSEPLCFEEEGDGEGDDDEIIVTLEEFLDRWQDGYYKWFGLNKDRELLRGYTRLTYELPAAPAELDFDPETGEITWEDGDDLGECADAEYLDTLVPWLLPIHPQNVEVDVWEIVVEPDVEDGDPLGGVVFSTRVPGNYDEGSARSFTLPSDYLDSLPDDTPVKVEVGAIGGEDNATFTEEDEFCVNDTLPDGGGECEEEGGTDCNGCGFEVED